MNINSLFFFYNNNMHLHNYFNDINIVDNIFPKELDDLFFRCKPLLLLHNPAGTHIFPAGR